MSDLISRKALCDDLREYKVHPVPISSDESEVKGYNDGIDLAISVIAEFPSAEPERKKGKWIEISWSETDPNVCCTSYAIQSAKCSICGKCHTTPYLHSLVYFPYCPNCGAEMNRGDR